MIVKIIRFYYNIIDIFDELVVQVDILISIKC